MAGFYCQKKNIFHKKMNKNMLQKKLQLFVIKE